MNVLLVEDDPDIGLMVFSALRTRGVTCTVVGFDFDGLVKDLAFLAYFDVVVMDVLLGESYTGIDLLEWIRLHMPSMKLVSYSAVITLNPRLRDIADACVLKGDINDLFGALGLEPA